MGSRIRGNDGGGVNLRKSAKSAANVFEFQEV